MSSNLEYSYKALESKSFFYGKELTVYVEGGEDVIYWNKHIEDICHIEQVHGYDQLIPYMEKIINNNARIIVACDSDHTPFVINDKYIHPRIVKSYGYSIENSMYCSELINNIIMKNCHKIVNKKIEINDWLKNFTISCENLLKYDIANYRYSKGVKVFGDSCDRFLKSSKSNEISVEKVNTFLNNIKSHFTNSEITEVEQFIKKDSRDLKFMIKGHFLSLAVINTIKKHIRAESGMKFNFSQDNLFSETCQCIDSCSSSCIAVDNEKKDMLIAIQNG